MAQKTKVAGLTKIRNEAHIIGQALDNWHTYCDWIHVYDDCSTDDTVALCKAHPAVREVITSDLMDPNRERAEWYNRQILLNSARRFLGPDDWIFYSDGDEFLYDFDRSMLDRTETPPCIAAPQYDAYITPDDVEGHFSTRKWVGPEWELVPFFYRNRFMDGWHIPDQRNATMRINMGSPPVEGISLHVGKAISVEHFDRKCAYYTDVFGAKYKDKWEQRKGQAVRDDYTSHFGSKLVLWQDVLEGRAETWHKDYRTIVE